MIQNIEKGKGFGGLFRYLSRKDGAKILGGTLGGSEEDILTQVARIRRLVPAAKKVISHISLSLPPGERLTDQQWAEVAEKYVERMGYENCAWMAVRHHDTEHDHVHIVVLRVDLQIVKVVRIVGTTNEAKHSARAGKGIRAIRTAGAGGPPHEQKRDKCYYTHANTKPQAANCRNC